MVQLSLIQFFRQSRIPGHLFRGKKRLVKQVTPAALRKLQREYELQLENMKYLLNPYLSVEQSQGHAKELMKTEAKIEFWKNNPIKPPFKPNVTIEDRLVHLRVKEVWE